MDLFDWVDLTLKYELQVRSICGLKKLFLNLRPEFDILHKS